MRPWEVPYETLLTVILIQFSSFTIAPFNFQVLSPSVSQNLADGILSEAMDGPLVVKAVIISYVLLGKAFGRVFVRGKWEKKAAVFPAKGGARYEEPGQRNPNERVWGGASGIQSMSVDMFFDGMIF